MLLFLFTKEKDGILNYVQVPIPLIVLIILVAIYLVVVPVISSPSIGFLIAAILILFGLVFYYPFVYRKIELKCMSK
jgi:L-type amino acid transporter 9